MENAAARGDIRQKTRSNARLLRAENETRVNRDYWTLTGLEVKLKLPPSPSSLPPVIAAVVVVLLELPPVCEAEVFGGTIVVVVVVPLAPGVDVTMAV